jgi:hypothetical protein
MLAHLLRSGTRALGVAIVLGTIVIFVTGGLSSPHATPLVGVSIAAFFIFWVAFACFARRSYTLDRLRDEVRHGDAGGVSIGTNRWIAGDKRTDDGIGEGGDGGGGGGHD